MCHVLNIVVKSGLSHLKDVLATTKKNVKRIKSSASLENKLTALCIPANLKFKRLSLHVPTRWNATRMMIDKVLYLKQPYQQLCVTEDTLETIHDSEWNSLKELVELLKPFEDCTNLFSSSSMATIGEMFVGYKHLLAHLECQEFDCVDVNHSISTMREKLQLYYNKQKEETIMTTILDPRIKLLSFSVLKKEEVLSVFKRFYLKYKSSEDDNCNTGEMGSGNSLIGNLHLLHGSLSANADEVERYLLMDLAGEGTNVLEWWKGASSMRPNLVKMARDYLAIMTTSTSSERMCSAAGQVITKSRNRLSDETAESTILLQSWSKDF